MIHVVKSSDGVEFSVNSEERSVNFDRAFASRQPATVLQTHGDFTRLRGTLGELIDPSEYVIEPHDIRGPLERRASFRVIAGGKS